MNGKIIENHDSQLPTLVKYASLELPLLVQTPLKIYYMIYFKNIFLLGLYNKNNINTLKIFCIHHKTYYSIYILGMVLKISP